MILPNKRHHKFLALFLTFILFCGVPFSANFELSEVKAADIIGSGTWGDNVTWEFDGSTLTLRGTGDMQDAPITWKGHTYTMHVPWSKYKKTIKKIVISEGITHIGKANFSTYFQALEVVVLPNSLISIEAIAFDGNTRLRTINFPPNLKTIGAQAFVDCTSLTNITFPASLTKIDDLAFAFNKSLTQITLPPHLKSYEHAFAHCTGITSVKISNGVTKVDKRAFSECYNLRSIDLPASVSSIGAMAFVDCKKLASVKIRNRHCKIDVHPLTFPKKTILYGYKNSTVEKYAKKHNLKFRTLDSSTSTKTVKIKKLKITGAPRTLKVGKSKTLKVKVTPTNATNKKVSWKSSNKKYATVNSKGKVTAKKAGRGKTVKITATAKDGSKKKVTVRIKIK